MSDHWYGIANPDHFWMKRRFDVLRKLAGDLIRNARNLAEIGCGNGVVQRCVEDYYRVPVTGFDLNDFALRSNMSRMSPVCCYDIHQRSPRFESYFDAILLLDVLEHISEETPFLESLRFHLASSGKIVINVPAQPTLYSAYDRAAGHVRRYSIGRLRNAAGLAGLRIASFTYWGAPLLPLLLLRMAILGTSRPEKATIARGFDPGSRVMNEALKVAARCEPIPQLLLGTSLMAVLDRNP
jgi:SAM-dependent methyltransferase